MKSITKLAVTTLLVVPLLQGCGDDTAKKESAGTKSDVVSGSQTSGNTATRSKSAGDYDENATFRMPKTADIQAEIEPDLEFKWMAGDRPGQTDCEGDYAGNPPNCFWVVPQAGVRDGTGEVEVYCHNFGKNYDTYIDEITAADPTITAVTDLGVPAAIQRVARSSRKAATLTLVFKLKTQAIPRVCRLIATPMWDDATMTIRTIDVDAAADQLLALGKTLIQ